MDLFNISKKDNLFKVRLPGVQLTLQEVHAAKEVLHEEGARRPWVDVLPVSGVRHNQHVIRVVARAHHLDGRCCFPLPRIACP